jgi:PPOX class probable F420-dependent enzyme
MPVLENSLSPTTKSMIDARNIATLATKNEDGSIHLTAVWYLFEGGAFYVATSSRTRKARNIAVRSNASLMIDIRKPGFEQGVSAVGTAELIRDVESRKWNESVHRRYLSAEALADPRVGKVFEAFDDVTIRLTPTSWAAWDMKQLDEQAFDGKLGRTPGYLLPLD